MRAYWQRLPAAKPTYEAARYPSRMAQRHSGKEWPKALLAAMLSSPGGITVVRAVKSVTIASTGPMTCGVYINCRSQ